MAIMGRTTCAVRKCGLPVCEFGNLCEEHELPGAIVRIGNDTGIVTCWYVERGHEAAVVVLNDFALGDFFGGRKAFDEKLRKQGFSTVRLLTTPIEIEAAKKHNGGKELASWGGPWKTQYPWESSGR
jgi:hypothetical protein